MSLVVGYVSAYFGNVFPIAIADIASIEQGADLYALEHTAKATASTSRHTSSRNSNSVILA